MQQSNNEKVISDIRDALTCQICQGIANIPVLSICCDSARRSHPMCLKCARNYFELNQPINDRPYNVKSLCGAGCDINPRARGPHYVHAEWLYRIRDACNVLEPITCQNCEENNDSNEFNTTAEARRHLNGSSLDTDEQGNCPYAITKCPHCPVRGVRREIEVGHFNNCPQFTTECHYCHEVVIQRNLEQHINNCQLARIECQDCNKVDQRKKIQAHSTMIDCPSCGESVKACQAKEHYENHEKQNKLFLERFSELDL